MINWKTASVITLLISGIYTLITYFINSGLSKTAFIAIISVTTLFFLVNLIQFIGKQNNPESRVQRFMIGTSIQMIVALFTLLIVRYTLKDFKQFAIYFMILFGIHLAIQATLLIYTARKNSN
jgi:heme O synthase-like polyprenyltransferase